MPSPKAILKNLKKAQSVADCSDFPRQRLGAILVNGNRVLAVGYNQTKTFPMQKRYNVYREFENNDSKNNGGIHAEMCLLQRTKYENIDWANCVLYVARKDKLNRMRIARPCPACLKAIKERGIKTVYYSVSDNEFGALDLSKED